MKKINYVMATWSGYRESIPKIPYIKRHIEQLESLNHDLSQITIGYPYNPKEEKEYKDFVDRLEFIKNTPIKIEPMPNNGRSYGQFSRIYTKYKNQFKYWIFIEDDYIPAIDYFDSVLIEEFEKKKKELKVGGFLCQCAKAWAGQPYHAAISNGISDNDSLNAVCNQHKGILPHDLVGYRNGQVIFSRAFLSTKLFLKDLTHRFKAPYFHLIRGIEEHNPKGEEYIIVPIQMIDVFFNQKHLRKRTFETKKGKGSKIIMISLITISYKLYKQDKVLEIFLESILLKSFLIDEIIIIYNKEFTFIKEEYRNNIKIKHIGTKKANNFYTNDIPLKNNEVNICEIPAISLHEGMEIAKNNYIFFSDPDVIYYTNRFDKLYLDLFNKFNLGIIGVSHHNPEEQAFGLFPTVISCLINKNSSPDKNWLLGEFKCRTDLKFANNKKISPTDDFSLYNKNYYLIPAPLPNYYKSFPNPSGQFDIGCNLWLWNHLKTKKNITFKVHDKNFYYINSIVPEKKYLNLNSNSNILCKHCKNSYDQALTLTKMNKWFSEALVEDNYRICDIKFC